MIKIETLGVFGWDSAIRGMRNPMNSWDKSDSFWSRIIKNEYVVGPNDLELMLKLAKAGPVHAKYRRMIVVYVDITAPLYWWKEFDTYKVGTVANSCSTMHKIQAKEFTISDFSEEHLTPNSREHVLIPTIDFLNRYRDLYLGTEQQLKRKDEFGVGKSDEELNELMKLYWWQMIQLLPSSYNQKRTVMLSYEVLAGMRPFRKNHKQDEWKEFCKWIDKLPHHEIIIGGEAE